MGNVLLLAMKNIDSVGQREGDRLVCASKVIWTKQFRSYCVCVCMFFLWFLAIFENRPGCFNHIFIRKSIEAWPPSPDLFYFLPSCSFSFFHCSVHHHWFGSLCSNDCHYLKKFNLMRTTIWTFVNYAFTKSCGE